MTRKKAVNQPRTEGGKFSSPYGEKRGDAIAIRLPITLDTFARSQAEREGKTVQLWLMELVENKATE